MFLSRKLNLEYEKEALAKSHSLPESSFHRCLMLPVTKLTIKFLNFYLTNQFLTFVIFEIPILISKSKKKHLIHQLSSF